MSHTIREGKTRAFEFLRIEARDGGLSCPDLADVRADFREHLCSWWKIHVRYASWGGEGRPPHWYGPCLASTGT